MDLCRFKRSTDDTASPISTGSIVLYWETEVMHDDGTWKTSGKELTFFSAGTRWCRADLDSIAPDCSHSASPELGTT